MRRTFDVEIYVKSMLLRAKIKTVELPAMSPKRISRKTLKHNVALRRLFICSFGVNMMIGTALTELNRGV